MIDGWADASYTVEQRPYPVGAGSMLPVPHVAHYFDEAADDLAGTPIGTRVLAEGPASASARSGFGVSAELRVAGAYAALLLDTIDGTCIAAALSLTAAPPVIPPRPGCE